MVEKSNNDELKRKILKLERAEVKHKQVEKALREREFLSLQMFAHSTTSMCLYNPEGTIIKANHEFCKMFGVEEKAIIDSGYNIFKDQAAIDAGIIPLVKNIFDKKKAKNWEIEFDIDSASDSTKTPTSKTGKMFLKAFGYPVLNYKGDLEYVVLQHYDITERILAKEALRKSEEKFRLAFHTSPDSINLNRVSDGMYLDINEGFTKILGYTRDDVIGKSSLSLNIWKNSKDRKRLVDGLSKAGYVDNLEAQFIKKNKEVATGLMSARVLSINGENVILSVTRDISALKQAQDMMVQAEKMMSVGGLAAGMAHEINNPLAGMIQSVDVMVRRLEDTKLSANIIVAEKMDLNMDAIKTYMEKRDILKMADAIKKTGYRMAKIVENMLSFARQSNAQVSSHSIAELLDKTIELAGTDFDLKKHYDFRNIKIQKKYQKDLPLIPCEATKIQQVFLNIINNSAHALQETNTENPVLFLRIWLEKKIKMVCIEIEDNGPGIDKETQKRIFEPFFTTKPVGVGTGLGLSVSYFIITENHKGEIEVTSEPDKGTKFTLRLRTQS